MRAAEIANGGMFVPNTLWKSFGIHRAVGNWNLQKNARLISGPRVSRCWSSPFSLPLPPWALRAGGPGGGGVGVGGGELPWTTHAGNRGSQSRKGRGRGRDHQVQEDTPGETDLAPQVALKHERPPESAGQETRSRGEGTGNPRGKTWTI